MRDFKLGVQLQPERTELDPLRDAWRELDRAGVDSIWVPDHFFPVSPGDPNGPNFECWSLLAAMAVDTSRAAFGALVSCVSYRNPDLLADMARTVSLLSGGRLVLGLGAGWCEREYVEYGYSFESPAVRLREFEDALVRIRARLPRLNPAAPGLRTLIGGGGEKVTLRLVAEHADLWNAFGPADDYRRKNKLLDEWCERVGRDPSAIERSVFVDASEVDRIEEFLAAGAEHVIVGLAAPYDLSFLDRLG
ncbi:LLM class F420-dependent oxidoreductase [Kitasatospora griseola]|uniref:5,10-methylene tetrahydromethanopterin reductase n=1 Tax=Kitasatospora griseola TaxID=2064 RepID=A0A0D0PSG5_KITGR|nr:LLM class F420-dependent oxidoreductase [Kitasatospora griseola]KIQ63337.1 5,10-methylene tetrahydromethanopterin reductase [Kitasatospora griseola]